MKTAFLSLLAASLPVFVASQSPAPSGSAPAPSGPAPAPSGAVPPAASSVSFTLRAQNPTAVPLASINSVEPPAPTIPLANTPAAGAQPTFIPNAPPLPNVVSLNPQLYPPLDKNPPTDTPEVQQWIKEVQESGIEIPNIAPTVLGGCAANAQAAADKSRCWWTCDGCTTETDITTCPDKLTWGSSFDDGPAAYTPNLLQYLDEAKLKTTFFVVGSRVISSPHVLQAQYMGQHQIAIHTWSHAQLTTLTNDQIIAELGWSKKAIKDVLGVTPNMFRPPYGDIDNRVRAICKAMGLTPVMWTRISPTQTFDTQDFDVKGGTVTSAQVLANWNSVVANATQRNDGFITLQHDLWEQAVELATGYILPDALAHQPPFKIQPVVECMKHPIANAYIETNDNKTNPPPNSGSGGNGGGSKPGGGAQTGNGNSDNAGIASWADLSYTTISLAFGAVIAGTILA